VVVPQIIDSSNPTPRYFFLEKPLDESSVTLINIWSLNACHNIIIGSYYYVWYHIGGVMVSMLASTGRLWVQALVEKNQRLIIVVFAATLLNTQH
jgi:hypothetical protein